MLGYEDDDLPEPEIDFNKEFNKLVWAKIKQSEIKGAQNIIKLMLEASANFCKEAIDLCGQNDTNTIAFWSEMYNKIQRMRTAL